MRRSIALFLLGACTSSLPPPAPPSSSSIALTSDDHELWVVNADADSVSVIDAGAKKKLAEIKLGEAPAVDASTGRYDPKVRPRALAILPGDHKVYVAGQSSGSVMVIDAASRTVSGSIPVGAEPVAVVASADGKFVYAVSHQAATVSKIDAHSDQVVASVPVGEHPWGASLSADGEKLYVSQFLLHPGVTVIDTAGFTVERTLELAEQMPDAANGKLVPNGVARGVYAAVPRPAGGELWLVHMLLAVQTAEPDLDFQSTTFPTVSTVDAAGMSEGKRLLFKPLDVAGAMGSFNDVVSQPRAIAFTPDGRLALVVNSASEDVLVLDGATGNERGLVRPLPATLPEGVAVDRAGHHAYVDGRGSHNVVVLDIDQSDAVTPVRVAGDPIERLDADPMPDMLRLGQRLFYSANSSAYPLTQNFWVSCSTCHLEGGTDAVTWRFVAGPRDTPSNAGGPINTGFLMRQALRNSVTQYDSVINVEQGGTFHRGDPTQQPLLDALAAFVNLAIPLPQNPNTPPSDQVARGMATFNDRCSSCHAGDWYTDSGAGNSTLDLAGQIMLHDVGTCVQGTSFDDQPGSDVDGDPRTACDFDTPTLRGIFATAPYFHDGSAATLRDVVDRLPFTSDLTDADKNDLVAFLQTL
jgi:YVTN family beta-propeller protein